MNDRYEGKPFLRLLECYVLWSVDQLLPGQAERLEDMAPKLASTYSTNGTWQDIVAAQMEFPPGLPDALRGMWERTLSDAGEQGVSVGRLRFGGEVGRSEVSREGRPER